MTPEGCTGEAWAHTEMWVRRLTPEGYRDCDTVLYNQKYVFGLHPHSWHKASKTLEIS